MNDLYKNNIQEFREVFTDLIDGTYKILDTINENRYSITLKDDNSPVTKSDLIMQDFIINFLLKRYPHIRIISEEAKINWTKPEEGFLYAIIDPIDGTENFCSGIEIWGVSISIWKYPNHIASLLFLPELKNHIMTGDIINKVDSRIHGFSSSFSTELKKLMEIENENRVMGCSVYNFLNVVRGSYKSFTNPNGAYIWDLISGLNLALENGCKVIVEGDEYCGEFLEPTRRYSFKIENK